MPSNPLASQVPMTLALTVAGLLSLVVPPALAQPTGTAGAQPSSGATSAARPARDPSDPRAAVPPMRHRSAFAGQRAASDAPPTDWREANETTARVGGWRAYAKQAQAPDAPASAAPVAASSPQSVSPPAAAPDAAGAHHGH